LREFKGKDETQVAWTNAWNGFLDGLVPYIKKFHTTGLAWNPRGGDAAVPKAAAAPKPAPAPKASPAAGGGPAKAGAALFSELNKGGAITSGLKKVARADTNKDKKISGKVEVKETPKKAVAAPKKPAVCELRGNKWCVEWQFNPASPVVVKTTGKNQTVYIYKCEGAVIIVEGKVNSIAVDGCKKTGIVFDELVATCEVMNCQSVKVQVKEKVPAIAVDKTAGILIYLPKTSLETEIVTATSSEMNVIIPNPSGKEEDDPVELPIPEQFKTVVKDGKLDTNQVDHSGG
jgi:adenylyl cyclase-associated protein